MGDRQRMQLTEIKEQANEVGGEHCVIPNYELVNDYKIERIDGEYIDTQYYFIYKHLTDDVFIVVNEHLSEYIGSDDATRLDTVVTEYGTFEQLTQNIPFDSDNVVALLRKGNAELYNSLIYTLLKL